MPLKYKSIGFIGLGAMGKPMAANLIKKTPKDVKINIYDISPEPVEELRTLHDCRVTACKSSKDLARLSVSEVLTLLQT